MQKRFEVKPTKFYTQPSMMCFQEEGERHQKKGNKRKKGQITKRYIPFLLRSNGEQTADTEASVGVRKKGERNYTLSIIRPSCHPSIQQALKLNHCGCCEAT